MSKVNVKVLAFANTVQAASMKVHGIMIIGMDVASNYTQMETNTKAISKIISHTVKVFTLG